MFIYSFEEENMNNIKTLSLAFMLFALFSISYLVTSVSAQMGSPDMASPGMGAPGTVCIPESAQDQARKFGFKCMTPETIERLTTRAATNCERNIIKGHGKVRAGKNDRRSAKRLDPVDMMEEVMEKTAFCTEKKSLLHCKDRVNSGLHVDDAFCFPMAERFCGGTEEIRIKADGKQIPYGTYVKWYPDLCAHYEIVPTQAAAIERLENPAIGMAERRKLAREEKQQGLEKIGRKQRNRNRER
jgi:hypothetical protein